MTTLRLVESLGVAQNADMMVLRSLVRSDRPVMSRGQVGLRATGGTVIRGASGFQTKPFAKVSLADLKPFDLSLVDAGGTYTGTFRPGVVNGLIPSNYLALTGISKTGLVYVKLDVTLTHASVQTATFSVTGAAPSSFPTSMGVPPTALSLLTHVVLDGTVYRVIGPGNPWLTPVASFETDKTGTISPGEKATDVWYSYSLTTIA